MESLNNKMKSYEGNSRYYLERKNPVILRIDGKGFSKYTKGFKKPFDDILLDVMHLTAKFLCENIQNCKLAYTQSDEISLLLIDYLNKDTDCWYGNNIQKMCSISASMATLAFNKCFLEVINCYYEAKFITEKEYKFYQNKTNLAMFDSRAFIVPKEDVTNYFIWRQKDAIRNSIQSLARSKFSQRELNNKNTDQMKEMLMNEFNTSWDELEDCKKKGVCLLKKEYELKNEQKTLRHKWEVDYEIPLFKEDRYYINKYL